VIARSAIGRKRPGRCRTTLLSPKIEGTMRRGKLIAFRLVLQLVPGAAIALRQGIEELFPARPIGCVTDHASVLDAASVREIERLIGDLRSAT
jgi:hypothetical protein